MNIFRDFVYEVVSTKVVAVSLEKKKFACSVVFSSKYLFRIDLAQIVKVSIKRPKKESFPMIFRKGL